MMLNRKVEIHIPRTPTYILCGDKEQTVPIEDFSDDELRQIGEQFVLNLVLAAQTRRKRDTTSSNP